MRNRCLIFDDAERKLGVDEYEQQKRISGEDALALCGYSRKHAIKALNKSGPSRALKRSEPKPRYDATVREVLQRFWLESYQLCGTRLKAALPEWLPHYGSEYGVLDGVLEGKWATISAASIDRLCSPCEPRARPKGRGGTKPGRWLKTRSPSKPTMERAAAWFMEADTVAHCGGSLEGDFIWSLCFTGLASGWTESCRRSMASTANSGRRITITFVPRSNCWRNGGKGRARLSGMIEQNSLPTPLGERLVRTFQAHRFGARTCHAQSLQLKRQIQAALREIQRLVRAGTASRTQFDNQSSMKPSVSSITRQRINR